MAMLRGSSAVSTLLLLSAARADMYDVLSPTMLAPATCPHGCDSWSARQSGALWAGGTVPAGAGNACAQPAKAVNQHPYGSWCYCKASGGDEDSNSTRRALEVGPAGSHPLDQQTFVMLNRFPGESSYVSFAYTDAPPSMPGSQEWMRATYTQKDAMPLTFNAVQGQPNVYTMQNKWPQYTKWVQYSDDSDAWIHASEPDSQMAMRIELVPQPGATNTYKMICRGKYGSSQGGCSGKYISFCTSGCDQGKWLRAEYTESDAMPVQLLKPGAAPPGQDLGYHL
jgi:hypothetical protein